MRAVPVLVLAAFLSGCTIPSSDTTGTTTGPAEPPVDAGTYAITADFFLTQVQPASNFTFTIHVDGRVQSESPHIGAHWGPASVEKAQASKTTYPQACVHVAGHLPGDYDVTCAVAADATPGTYYLRGHAQEVRGNTTVNWWSDEKSFMVA